MKIKFINSHKFVLCIFQLMIQGRDVFMGYMGNEADTKASFDRDFRMRTGDLARVDNGFLKITGLNNNKRLFTCIMLIISLA